MSEHAWLVVRAKPIPADLPLSQRGRQHAHAVQIIIARQDGAKVFVDGLSETAIEEETL